VDCTQCVVLQFTRSTQIIFSYSFSGISFPAVYFFFCFIEQFCGAHRRCSNFSPDWLGAGVFSKERRDDETQRKKTRKKNERPWFSRQHKTADRETLGVLVFVCVCELLAFSSFLFFFSCIIIYFYPYVCEHCTCQNVYFT